MKYTVVQITRHANEGNTMHRCAWPMQALGKTLPEFRVIDVHYLSPWRHQLAIEADLLVLAMLDDAEIVPIILWRRGKGKPTVYELSDYLFDLTPWNPTFEFWENPAIQANSLQMMAMADMVQTTSPFLAKAFEPYSSRIAIFPNQLPGVPGALPERPARPLVVGWGGHVSHAVDLARVAPAVSEWIREHNDVVLSIMGDEELGSLFAVPLARKRSRPWGTMDSYLTFLGGLHIGLAPLRDTPFNRGRSDVKWLEYAAHGCVFVGQKIPPYTDSVEDGKTGFLFHDTAELLRILDRLHEDEGLMDSVRRAAFDHVTKQRRYVVHAGERAAVYRQLLEQTPPRDTDSWDLHKRVRFPRVELPDPLPDYFPLRLEPDEVKTIEDLYSNRPEVCEAAIRLVEERYGEFHLTCYARTLLALMRKNLSTADMHLRRSLSFYPAHVQSLVVHAKVLQATGRFKEARERLSCALQWHPAYLPTHDQIMNLLEEQSDWEGALAAAEEWEKFANHDPRARIRGGAALIRAGREEEGMARILDGMNRIKQQWKFWQLSFAAEVVQVLRKVDGLMSKDVRWQDLIVKAAEMFPYGMWLAVRAGAICFQRGDYERGSGILEAARERLAEWQWQQNEGIGPPPQYRGLIEIYRTACEELGNPAERGTRKSLEHGRL